MIDTLGSNELCLQANIEIQNLEFANTDLLYLIIKLL